MSRHKHLHGRHPHGDHEKRDKNEEKHENKREDKRDSNKKNEEKQGTLVSVVYVTAAPTFDGPIGGYSTLGPAIAAQPSQTARPAPQQPQQQAQSPSPAPASSVQANAGSSGDGNTQVRPAPQTPTSQSKSAGDDKDDASQKPATTQQPSQNTEKTDSSSVVQIQSQSTTSLAPAQSSQNSSSRAASTSRASSSNASPSAVSATKSSPSLLSSSSPSTTRPTGTSLTSSSGVSSPAAVQSTAAAPSPSEGLSGGAKAGIALGLILGLGAIFALIFLCLRRRQKRATYTEADDEKSRFSNQSGEVGGGAVNRASSVRTARTATNAPRLSLRPVTQFEPDLANEKAPNGNTRAAGAAGANANHVAVPGVQVNGVNSTSDPTNPFGTHAETSSHMMTGLSPPPPVGAGNRTTAWPSAYSNPAELQGHSVESDSQVKPVESNMGAAMVGAAMAAPVMAASQHTETPNVQETTAKAVSNGDGVTPSASNQLGSGNVDSGLLAAMPVPPPSPQSAAAAAAGAGGAKNAPVHRVQMDFKPSMADELALRVGQLVRILHEYDDGWARCIRLDGSETGVAPRTCMSSRPVKPRPVTPQGPGGNHPRGPVAPGERVPTPNQGGRPDSPQFRNFDGAGSPVSGDLAGPPRSGSPAPLNPANGRHSPGPYKAYSPGPLSPTNSNNSGRNSPVPAPYAAPPRPRSPAGGSRSNSPVLRSATPIGQQVLGAQSAAQQFTRPSPRMGSPGPNNQMQSTTPPPQRLPTVLRSGSPAPSSNRSNSPPARKPLPGQAM
ncbi:MAG: hypothetical protein M1816_000788 [Peltula sp. TS41687]|nr:MAG: hypothetical protein M1816_000788 [Peltula sp. TS41687]